MELYQIEYELLISTDGGDGRRWQDIGLQFVIEKTAAAEPNVASFVIYNLSADSRSFVERADRLFFRAGYKGTARTLFSGDITQAVSYRGGTEWVTEVECGDGQE